MKNEQKQTDKAPMKGQRVYNPSKPASTWANSRSPVNPKLDTKKKHD